MEILPEPPRSDSSSSGSSDGGGGGGGGDGPKVASMPREDSRARKNHGQGSSSKGGRKGGKKRNGRKRQHSLDHLKRRISALMAVFEEHGLFLPPPARSSTEEKGKVWSNRNYGQDKKRQRKASERAFLESRIAQLEACLVEHDRDLLPEED